DRLRSSVRARACVRGVVRQGFGLRRSGVPRSGRLSRLREPGSRQSGHGARGPGQGEQPAGPGGGQGVDRQARGRAAAGARRVRLCRRPLRVRGPRDPPGRERRARDPRAGDAKRCRVPRRGWRAGRAFAVTRRAAVTGEL
ncbi:MAG: FIG004851: hypothetical protein, partial [uncultured Sphingomonadaceae bacterium]